MVVLKIKEMIKYEENKEIWKGTNRSKSIHIKLEKLKI